MCRHIPGAGIASRAGRTHYRTAAGRDFRAFVWLRASGASLFRDRRGSAHGAGAH